MLTQVSSHLLIVLSLLLFPFGCANESDSEEVPGNPSPAGMDDGTSGSTSVDSQAGGGRTWSLQVRRATGAWLPPRTVRQRGENRIPSRTRRVQVTGEAPSEEGGEGPITPPECDLAIAELTPPILQIFHRQAGFRKTTMCRCRAQAFPSTTIVDWLLLTSTEIAWTIL